MAALIDFHTHLFSRAFFDALAELSPLPGTPADRVERVARELALEAPPRAHVELLQRWLGEMERFGVQHMVSIAGVPQEADALAECLPHAGGRVSAVAVLDPRAKGAARRARTLLDAGFSGLFFLPAQHRFRLDGPELSEVLDVLAEDSGVAFVHCGLLRLPLRDAFAIPRDQDPSLANPLHLIPAADRHPRVRFVIPHFGAGMFRETLMAGAQCPNVYVDTSSSNAWTATQESALRLADVFERALGVFGSQRILFGTDSTGFPRGWRNDVLVAQREALGACGLDARAKGHILHANAAGLLKLGAPLPSSARPGEIEARRG